MDCKIVWTEPALVDLESVIAYIARENPSAATKLGKDILSHVELLASFPHIGPHYPRGAKSGDREILCAAYRIFYRISEDSKTVEILTTWHGARQDPELPS